MVTFTALGQAKPKPVDAESLLLQYFQLLQSDNTEDGMSSWVAKKSGDELAAIPCVIGFGLLNQIEGNILADSTHYNASMSATRLIEKGIAEIETSGSINALYLTTNDAGLIPVRYILANAYDKVLKYEAADSAYIQTANEIGRDFGVNSEEFVFWTNQCAESLQRKNKNYNKAIRLLLPAKEAALHSHEVSDSTACRFLISLAQKYQRSGNHDEAKMLAHEAEKRMGGNHESIFNVYNTLGELYWVEGKHETSLQYFRKAETNAPSLSHFFAAGINYANILRQTCHRDDAETTLLALEKYVNSDELEPEDLFSYFESLGVLFTFSNPDKSAEYFRRAENYIDYISYPELIRHILNSQVYPNEGNSFKIISALDRAENVFNMLIGNEPRLFNELLLLKGFYSLDIHDYKNAGKYYEAAYINMLDYASGDPQILDALRHLALLDEIDSDDIREGYYLGEVLREAIVHGETSDLYLNAVADMLHFCLQTKNEKKALYYLEIYKKHRPRSFDTQCYDYRLKMLKGKIGEAEKVLKQIKKKFPEESANVNLMYQRFYAAQKSPKIAEVADKVFEDFKAELLRRLLFMSTNERRNMDHELRSRRDEIISAVRFAPELSELALNYSLFSKGLLFHTQSEISELLARSDSAQRDIANIKSQKAELMRAMNSADARTANEIQRVIDSRERYLVQDYVDFNQFTDRLDRYTTSKLYGSLTGSEVMLDFVEYLDDGKMHVGVFMIEKGQPVRFMALGESLNLCINGKISEHIWSGIIPQLSRDKRIYFSTDGILNATPIEFAEDEDGIPMCDKYDLHRVFHLSDIRSDVGIGNRVEAIGVADHNSPPGNARSLDDGYRGNWNDLAGVEAELFRIAESLDGVSEYHRVFNDDATEHYIKTLSGHPITTLHISTHGFYRGEEALTKAFSDSTDFDHNIARRLLSGNRTSVSGLIMRNGNLSWKAESITEDEDNILTSEEVETLSFPDLNLTVLSACDTGLGELSADGVWGLQRAFRIAGSSALICSLHNVKDNGAADFMAEFYRHAVTGISVHDAFYNARKELVVHDPANKEVWSSFILIE